MNENTLWENIKKGDKKSFNQLFRQYYSQLYFYGIKIHPDPELVKECVQEVYIRIWETREKLGNISNPRSYLIVSIRRQILSTKGKKNIFKKAEQIDDSSFLFELNEFEKNETIPPRISKFLLQTINSLPKKQQELIMLYFYHELGYQEISTIMGISIQAARNLMYRTLTHLRKSIGKENLDKLGNLFFELFLAYGVKKV